VNGQTAERPSRCPVSLTYTRDERRRVGLAASGDGPRNDFLAPEAASVRPDQENASQGTLGRFDVVEVDGSRGVEGSPVPCPCEASLPSRSSVADSAAAVTPGIVQTDHSADTDHPLSRDNFEDVSYAAALEAAPKIANAIRAAKIGGLCSTLECGALGPRAVSYWRHHVFDLVNGVTRFAPFCRRHTPPKMRRLPKSRCASCRRPVVREAPSSSDRTFRFFKRFCCAACESRFWKRDRDGRRAAARSEKRCGNCRKRLVAQRSDRQFCNDRCRKAAHRRARAAEKWRTIGLEKL
jgi:hypothetical protein